MAATSPVAATPTNSHLGDVLGGAARRSSGSAPALGRAARAGPHLPEGPPREQVPTETRQRAYPFDASGLCGPVRPPGQGTSQPLRPLFEPAAAEHRAGRWARLEGANLAGGGSGLQGEMSQLLENVVIPKEVRAPLPRHLQPAQKEGLEDFYARSAEIGS